jgi:hypothetical protein
LIWLPPILRDITKKIFLLFTSQDWISDKSFEIS